MTAYDTAVLADSPLMYWPLNETSTASTTITDATTHAFNGTIAGGYTLNQTGPSTNGPAAAILCTTNAVITGSGSTQLAPANMTAEFWVKFNTVTAEQFILAKFNGGNSYFVRLTTASKIQFRRYDVLANVVDIVSASLSSGTWYYGVATSDSSGNAKLYINDSLTTTGGPLPSTPAATTALFEAPTVFGGNPGLNSGTLAAVAVYGSVLSSAQVDTHYLAAFPAAATANVIRMIV